jgi:hypothetical protein
MSRAGAPGDWLARELASLLADLGGRAAGFWAVRGDRLVQLTFVGGEGLDPETARAFAAATREVPLDRGDLGIVRAYRKGRPVVSTVSELPAENGSGRWLRAFGAERSIAVPLEIGGAIAAVVSIALGGSTTDDRIAERLRREGDRWAKRLAVDSQGAGATPQGP